MSYVSWITNIYRRAGNRRARARQWELAAKAYRQHLRLRPKDASVWIQLGHAEKETGRFDEAEAAYARAAAIAKQDADPYLHLAHLLRRQGRLEDALYAFRRLERLAPDAEVSEAVRQLGKLHRHRNAITPAPDAMLFIVQDYMAALAAGRQDEPEARREAGIILAALAESGLDAHFIVNDEAVPAADSWLAFDPGALCAILRLAVRGETGRPAFAEALFAAQTRARPIVPQADSFLVLLGTSMERRNDLGRLMRTCQSGARLTAVIDDAVLQRLDGSGAANRDTRLMVTELLHVSDFVLTQSDLGRSPLHALVGKEAGGPAVLATVEQENDAALGRAGFSFHALRRWRASRETVAGVATLAALRRLQTDNRGRRARAPAALDEGVVFWPGGAPAENGMASGNRGSLRWMFGSGFDRVDAAGAWIGGGIGHVRFGTNLCAGVPFAIRIALAVPPEAIGRRCSLAFADTPEHEARWMTLTDQRLFVRLDGKGSPDGACVLKLMLRDVTPSIDRLSSVDHRQPAGEGGAGSIGVAGISYHRLDQPHVERDLCEQLLFG